MERTDQPTLQPTPAREPATVQACSFVVVVGGSAPGPYGVPAPGRGLC
jgi:hypothetical protein